MCSCVFIYLHMSNGNLKDYGCINDPPTTYASYSLCMEETHFLQKNNHLCTHSANPLYLLNGVYA